MKSSKYRPPSPKKKREPIAFDIYPLLSYNGYMKNKNTGNCLIAQSGGPTSAINASLAGLIAEFKENCDGEIFGALNGIQGVLSRNIINFKDLLDINEENLEKLKISPAMYLGSCRYKLEPFQTAINQLLPDYERIDDYTCIFNILKEYNIKYFFYIGGNDSMDTVKKLGEYAKSIDSDISFMGVPKTIDNDLPVTDHTPGYGSAARYIAASMLEMAYDTSIYNTKSVLIVEIMGRNAGWLTAASALARTDFSDAPHLIYLPEKNFSDTQFLSDLREKLTSRSHVIIAVSEGIHYQDGTYVSAAGSIKDQFGHVMLNGAGRYLAKLVSSKIGCKVRSVELNVLQRCSAHLSSLTDINESFELGKTSARAALSGESAKMSCLRRIKNEDGQYAVEYFLTEAENVANKEKKLPLEWINQAGNDITQEFLDYARPLILGQPKIEYQNGLPVYLSIRHLGV